MQKDKINRENIKHLGSVYLYNMLQDFRHLLIFDLRSAKDFQDIFVRDSFNVTEQTDEDMIQQVIQRAEQKATQKQTKYKQLKRVRRYFFVGAAKLDAEDKVLKRVVECLEINKSKDDKVYALDTQLQAFAAKYSFMCLGRQKLSQIQVFKSQNNQKQADKILLYPYSKFPSELIPDKLYLGNVYSSNSQKQLQELGIKNLIDFIDYTKQQKIPEFKQAKYNWTNLPFSKDVPANIDFDIINQELDRQIAKGKTLFYCRDGEVISPAFVIAYLMYKCKLDINMATLKVCQAISRVEVCKWIYTQLLTYKPKSC